MIKNLVFDMDGTIADLYSVTNWLPMLRDENPLPYMVARPLLDMDILNFLLENLKAKGFTITIVTWGSKNASKEYDRIVAEAKKEWLFKMNFPFDNFYFQHYGEPKHNMSLGILFDDNEDIRNEWPGRAYDETNIIKILADLLLTE